MCWLCGSYRPYDGPTENKLNAYTYTYAVGKIQYTANEAADWENLNNFPAWDAVDADNIPYFIFSESDRK